MTRVALVVAIVAGLVFAALPAAADAHTLTYKQAKRAAQAKGDQIAAKRTRLSTLLRQNRHRYYAQVKWSFTDPDGCKSCGFNPDTGEVFDTATTVQCFAEITVRFRSQISSRVMARIQSKSCF